jgi:hypothetical protein
MNNAPGSIYEVFELFDVLGTSPGTSVRAILAVVAMCFIL